MNTARLGKHFEECQLPVRFLDEHPNADFWARFGRSNIPALGELIHLDVERNRQSEEFFEIYVDYRAELLLLDKNPDTRHLLLLMRGQLERHRPIMQHYLLGHDERQLFIIGRLDGVSNLRDAFRNLMPREAQKAQKRGLKVIRQGEWFFYPAHGFEPPKDALVYQDRALMGGGGNPHTATELVWVLSVTGEGYFQRQSWEVYVRGVVRHKEHATVKLRNWHRAVSSTGVGPTFGMGYAD